MKTFDWEEFETEEIAVHCKNKEEENNFLKMAEKHGFKNYVYRFYDIPDVDDYIYVLVRSIWDDKYVVKVTIAEGFTILEWSDYMEFTKEDLKVGMLVETGCGIGIIMPNTICDSVSYGEGKWDYVDFDDVKKVWGYSVDFPHTLSHDTNYRNLLYERPTTKEMTVEEVSKALGYEVKIVKG